MYIHRENTLDQKDEIKLNEKELEQMEMRPYDTTTTLINTAIDPKTSISPPISPDKITKIAQRTDGTVSDSGLSTQMESNRKRIASKQSKAFVILGLSKKANSSNNVGLNKRSGFQRSEEIGVQPHLRNRALERQISKESDTPTSAPVVNSSLSPFNVSFKNSRNPPSVLPFGRSPGFRNAIN